MHRAHNKDGSNKMTLTNDNVKVGAYCHTPNDFNLCN